MSERHTNRFSNFGLRWLFGLITLIGLAIGLFTSYLGRLRTEADTMASLTATASIRVAMVEPPRRVESRVGEWFRWVLGFEAMTNALTVEIQYEKDLRYLNELNNVFAIQELVISECSLVDFRWFNNARNLQVLRTSKCQLENLEGLARMRTLKVVELERCLGLNSLKGLSHAPRSLKRVEISVDSNLLPAIDQDAFSGLDALEELELGHIDTIDLNWLAHCRKLRRLSIEDATPLQSLAGIEDLRHLETLELGYSQQLCDIRALSKLNGLRSLQIALPSEKSLMAIRHLDRLETLITGAKEMESLSGLEGMKGLSELRLSGVSRLKSISELNQLLSLQQLSLADGSADLELETIVKLKNLKTLYLESCKSLRSIDFLKELDSLEILRLVDCEELTDIMAVSKFASLKRIEIRKCRRISRADVEAIQLQCPGVVF